eukprot:CAMPEP_0197037780 /NCGR_PEP_ID=MMETSP1384-20130603/14903_1 /TAXON_ID=29189 /ORGANISM="Ammonia sp." /LENGTH=65 /DNA_ID=CAMNT_0042468131 /DNA_START=424 /DNA_END=621 /DNA_ORIENTATION=-
MDATKVDGDEIKVVGIIHSVAVVYEDNAAKESGEKIASQQELQDYRQMDDNADVDVESAEGQSTQ